jgi:hypothetical protein
MDKKVSSIVVVAALSTELVVGAEHCEYDKPPVTATVIEKVKSKCHVNQDHAQPHIEPGGPPQVTDFTLNQIA